MGRTARTTAGVAAGVIGLWATAVAVNRSLRRVQGGSMAPTLVAGDLVVTLPAGRVLRGPGGRALRGPRGRLLRGPGGRILRGDVVLVRDPRDVGHVQVKRVVGLPGETIEVRDGTLVVDGRRHREAHQHGRGPDGRLVVPADHVAVLGDARDASTDSRTYGPVPLELVERRVPLVLRPWPRSLRSLPTPLAPARGAAQDARDLTA